MDAKRKLYRQYIIGHRTDHEDLSVGAIGCYLSHDAVWHDALERRHAGSVLVVEDDARLPVALQTWMSYYQRVLPSDWGVIVFNPLYYSGRRMHMPGTWSRLKPGERFFGTHLMLVRPRAMRALRRHPHWMPISKQIDAQLSQLHHVTPIYFAYTGNAGQYQLGTDIQTQMKKDTAVS